MWENLIQANQLVAGKKIRKLIFEGNDQHETIYTLSRVGQHVFFIQMIEQNNNVLYEDQQIILPYLIANIVHHGFQIWEEQDVL